MSGTAKPKPIDEFGYWLPENHMLLLTALEAGALHAILYQAKARGIGLAVMCKPDADGKPVEISLIDRLIEKVTETHNRAGHQPTVRS